MDCGHLCHEVCHIHGVDEASPCEQKCNKKRDNCIHRCQYKCHGSDPCPDDPCQAEIKIKCKCGWRHVVGICGVNSEKTENTEQIECNKECKKNERTAKIAEAFKKGDDATTKELRADYYPDDLIEWAIDNLKFVKMVEKAMAKTIRDKEPQTLPEQGNWDRRMTGILIREHYLLDWNTYGLIKSKKRVTDIYYRDGESQVPTTTLSQYVELIKKGVLSNDQEERKQKLFEASLRVMKMAKGFSGEDLK